MSGNHCIWYWPHSFEGYALSVSHEPQEPAPFPPSSSGYQRLQIRSRDAPAVPFLADPSEEMIPSCRRMRKFSDILFFLVSRVQVARFLLLYSSDPLRCSLCQSYPLTPPLFSLLCFDRPPPSAETFVPGTRSRNVFCLIQRRAVLLSSFHGGFSFQGPHAGTFPSVRKSFPPSDKKAV